MVKIRDIFTVKYRLPRFANRSLMSALPPLGGRKDQKLKAFRVSLSTSIILQSERPFNEQNVQNIKARHHGCNK